MANVYIVHWDQSEIESLAIPLTREGHSVRTQWNPNVFDRWVNYRPDLVIISLERLPSHGRSVAEWIWESESRRSIPIIFVGGAPDKVNVAKKKFPNAVFVPIEKLPAMIGQFVNV
ncbi:MAG: response regulator transcription factor [Fimbriimonadales bacterium]|nr:response regulator transcription factor [Fimbriimonadales bacterium]